MGELFDPTSPESIAAAVWRVLDNPELYEERRCEARRLALDSSAAEGALGWEPRWDLQDALAKVVEWHDALRRGEDARGLTISQIETFQAPPR